MNGRLSRIGTRAVTAAFAPGQIDTWRVAAPILLLAAAVALAATTGVGVGASWFDEQRIILLVALSTAVLVAQPLSPVPHDTSFWAVVAALALGLLSTALAPRSFVALADWSVLFLIVLLVVSARAPRLVSVETTAALVGGLVPSAYVAGVLANYVSSLLLGFPVGAETLLVGFSNPRFPPQLQVLTIPLLPLAAQKAPTQFWRACLVVVASLWWMCFIGSGSRTGWIAIAAATLVVPFLALEGRRWLKWQLAFALSGALLWIVLFHALPAVLSIATTPETGRFSEFASVGARWRLWWLSVDAALAHPLLGLGPMHFAYVDNGDGAHPHNFWLQLAAEWGFPAALLLGCAALTLLWKLTRRVRSDADPSSRWLGTALLAAVVAWGVGTLSDGYMVIPTSQAMSTVVLMLAVMWLRLGTPVPAPSTANRVTSVVMVAFAAIALVVLAALPFTDFGQPTRREQMWRAEHPGQILWPRFWQQGWIGPDADPTARPAGGVPKASR